MKGLKKTVVAEDLLFIFSVQSHLDSTKVLEPSIAKIWDDVATDGRPWSNSNDAHNRMAPIITPCVQSASVNGSMNSSHRSDKTNDFAESKISNDEVAQLLQNFSNWRAQVRLFVDARRFLNLLKLL